MAPSMTKPVVGRHQHRVKRRVGLELQMRDGLPALIRMLHQVQRAQVQRGLTAVDGGAAARGRSIATTSSTIRSGRATRNSPDGTEEGAGRFAGLESRALKERSPGNGSGRSAQIEKGLASLRRAGERR
jgi:hypothetical protein